MEGQSNEKRHSCHKRSSGSWAAFIAYLFLISYGVSGQSQQQIGVDICACSPSTFTFTFDFNLTCPPVNVTVGNGVSKTSCLIKPFGNSSVTDLIPVSVQSIGILEIGQDLRILVQEDLTGNYVDGDSFNYTSISANPSDIKGPNDIPRAIQINLVGVNKNDEPIINFYVITFTNDCQSYPALTVGESAGWTIFVSDT